MKLFALTLVAATLVAGAASAQNARIAVGDLNLATPDGAGVLDARIESTARDLCRGVRRPVSLISDRAYCTAAVRAEVMRQLPARAKAEYAQARRGTVTL